jgi:hypothetical protein
MKIFIQVIDTKTAIYQTGMIEESVLPGLEIENALKHFGIIYGEVTWNYCFTNRDVINTPNFLIGYIEGTSKIISVVSI